MDLARNCGHFAEVPETEPLLVNVPISAELPVALQAAAGTTSVTLSFRCSCCYSLLAVTVTGTPIGLSSF